MAYMLFFHIESGKLHLWRLFGRVKPFVGHHCSADLVETYFRDLLKAQIAAFAGAEIFEFVLVAFLFFERQQLGSEGLLNLQSKVLQLFVLVPIHKTIFDSPTSYFSVYRLPKLVFHAFV